MAGEDRTSAFPAFICCTDSSNSAARSRFASYARNCASVRGLLFEGTTDLLQLRAGEVVGLRLRVQRQQDKVLLRGAHVVDDSYTTRLARTSPAPPHLPDAARARHYISGVGAFCDKRREFAPL